MQHEHCLQQPLVAAALFLLIIAIGGPVHVSLVSAGEGDEGLILRPCWGSIRSSLRGGRAELTGKGPLGTP